MLTLLVAPDGPSEGEPLVMLVRRSSVALGGPEHLDPADALFLGTLDGRHCWAVDVDDDRSWSAGERDDGRRDPVPDRLQGFVDLMRLFGEVDEATWLTAGRAVQLVEWRRTHRFCGRCGAPTEEMSEEHSRRCPRCGLHAFPRLAPAVIALVERDDGRALLARNARWPTGMYSCLAGFVEPGETVEDALHREIGEEVGLHIDQLRYRRSQPWPFPHSLMLGFNARHAGGEIRCDRSEIADAQWFSPDALPELPGPISIARWLIEDWLRRARGGDPA